MVDISHYAKQAGLKPSDLFSPENQDKMAIKEMERVNVNTSILKEEGLNERSLDKLAPIWASLPYSPKGGKSYYGQSYKNPNELISVYKKQLGIKQADLAKMPTPPVKTQGKPSKSDSKGSPGGKGKIYQYFHGDPGREGYEPKGHYNHDHYSFTSRGSAVNAFKRLKSAKFQPYEFEGYGRKMPPDSHSPSGGHFGLAGGKPTYDDESDGTAFDIPYSSYGSGPIGENDFKKSRTAYKIVNSEISAPVAQGGGYIGKNPKVYGGINESASYEQSGMMIMIQPMIIEKSSPSMSGGGNMDKITFAGSGSVNSVNPAAERG